LLLVAFLLVNAPNYHLSLVLASVVQGDALNCNNDPQKVLHTLLSGALQKGFQSALLLLRVALVVKFHQQEERY